MKPKILLSMTFLCLLPGTLPSARAQFIQQGGPLTYMNGGVAVSADGNTVIVGDFGHNNFTGGVLIFTRTNGLWSQQGSELVGAGAVASDGDVAQGSSVALSADGDTALVGGPFDGGDDRGAVWVFTRSNGIWVQQGPKLVGSGASQYAMYGDAVALSADGNTALVASGSGDGPYVFTRNNGGWSQQGGILTGTLSGCFEHVALSADGNTALVGDFCADPVGAGWVYTRTGGIWILQGKLVGSGSVGDSFQGTSVALSSDGNTALVGGYWDNNFAGAVWVFTRNSNGTWSQQGAKLTVGDAVGSSTDFGESVALSGDGNTAMVNGPGDSSYAGATWVFRRSNGVWAEQSKLLATGGDSVAISADGGTAIIGDIRALIYVSPTAVTPPTLQTLETFKGPNPTNCSVPQVSNSFSPSDTTVNVYFAIAGMNPTGGDTVTLNWINPSSFWAWTSTWNPTANNGSSTRCFFVDFSIAQYIAPIWGQWQVQAYVNSNSVGSPYSFLVSNIAAGAINFAEIGAFRSTSGLGTFLLNFDHVTYNYAASNTLTRFFGLQGDQPVAGDWTGNGQVRIGVFRPSEGKWYLDLNNNGQWDGIGGGDGIYAFGLPGDIAVVGDWNGDGRTKLGIFRCPQVGVCTWVLDYAGRFAYDPGTAKFYSYGLPGDLPVANNWNGTSNVDQIGVYRPMPNGLGFWIVDSNGSGTWEPSDAVYQFGLSTDLPVVGNWNNGTRKRIGIFRNGMWVLDTNGNNAYDVTDGLGFFGLPGDKPVVGNWTTP